MLELYVICKLDWTLSVYLFYLDSFFIKKMSICIIYTENVVCNTWLPPFYCLDYSWFLILYPNSNTSADKDNGTLQKRQFDEKQTLCIRSTIWNIVFVRVIILRVISVSFIFDPFNSKKLSPVHHKSSIVRTLFCWRGGRGWEFWKMAK